MYLLLRYQDLGTKKQEFCIFKKANFDRIPELSKQMFAI